MQYLAWALLALVAYALVAPLVSLATREIPADLVVATTNAMLAGAAVLLVLATDTPVRPHLTGEAAPYMYAAGALLAVAIVAYYRALAAGPVSVVVPIFGTFVVLSSLVGVVALGEPLTPRKGLGIAFAAVAIWLTSTA